jgi:hypothetical protein
MSTKQENLDSAVSCWNKAEADEPVFILRAKDPIAPMVVRIWASLAAQMQAHERDKTFGAFMTATEMEEWARRQFGEPALDWKR